MINSHLKPLSHYSKNKVKFNKSYNYKWKKIAGPKYIGLCSFLFQDFYKKWKETKDTMPSVHDFANYYLNNTNPVHSNKLERDDSIFYGRSVEELYNLSIYYQKLCNNFDIPIEDYFDDIINHAIIETYNGQIREVKLIEEYEKRGFTAEHTSGYWDRYLGVDFIIKKNGIIRDYIQCKPLSTFSPNANKSCIDDRVGFFHKEDMKKKECEKKGLPYYPTKFILYNQYKNDWVSINGKRGFLLEELIDRQGNTLININY